MRMKAGHGCRKAILHWTLMYAAFNWGRNIFSDSRKSRMSENEVPPFVDSYLPLPLSKHDGQKVYGVYGRGIKVCGGR